MKEGARQSWRSRLNSCSVGCPLIAATGSAGDNVSVIKTAASAIPFVFLTGNDPITLGLVTSVNRRQGNITGVSFFANVLGGKATRALATPAGRPAASTACS
jgi:ABC-type uncharacterized transport system substrate-binding protein